MTKDAKEPDGLDNYQYRRTHPPSTTPPAHPQDEELDEVLLYIKEQCIDTSDPGLVWFNFDKAKAALLAWGDRQALKARRDERKQTIRMARNTTKYKRDYIIIEKAWWESRQEFLRAGGRP